MTVAGFLDAAELRGEVAAWRDLCARAEPNPFADPDFLLPLIAYERPRLRFAAMRRGGRWIGFAALSLPPVGLARIWMSPYAALPAFALDAEDGAEAVAALLRLLEERTRLAGLIWPYVEAGSRSEAALRASGLAAEAGQTRRAAQRLAGAAAFDAGLNPKRRTKWARQGRKLAGMGRLETLSGASAVEAFLAVEPRGWKGARGTALADAPDRLAFAHAALAGFAEAGRLDAMALALDGAPVAAGLVLRARDRAFYWKTAYDEVFAETSPGVQLTLAHTRRLAETAGLDLVDSCAAEDHPMIGRVWGDRLDFRHIALAIRPEGARPLTIWLALDRLRASAREGLKRIVAALRER